MTRIVPFEAISPAQRSSAADVLISAFSRQPAAWSSSVEAAAEVSTFFDDKDRSALAAIEDGELIGWVGLVRGYSHAWELHPLAVSPDHQRRGVGAELVAALEALARRQGALTLYLGADDDFGGTNLFGADPYPDVLGALGGLAETSGHPFAFYRKLGFVEVGLIPDANGRGKPDILMAKRIT